MGDGILGKEPFKGVVGQDGRINLFIPSGGRGETTDREPDRTTPKTEEQVSGRLGAARRPGGTW